MNKKILMSGIKKDGTYKTPGGVPFMTSTAYRTHIGEAMVPHYRVDEFMHEVYGYAELIGIVDNNKAGEKIRVYRVSGGKYKTVYSGSGGFDADYYYVDDAIDPNGNLLYFAS